jgi:carbonic anhydrase
MEPTALTILPLVAVLALCAPAGCASSTPPPESRPPSATASPGDAGAAPQWSYEGSAGPARWGSLSPDFALCNTGLQQAPIALPASGDADHAAPLAFAYHPSRPTLLNTGHMLQVIAAAGSTVVVGPTPDDRYELVQFHFHSPSEHAIAGKAFDMEVHLVHRNASGKLLVVAVLLEKGRENPTLAPIFALAPTEVGKELHPEGLSMVDPGALLPARAGYFRYEGSLTAPPCSEGVSWYVMSTAGEVSDGQIARYQSLFHGSTNRPRQPLGARRVVEYQP